MMYYEVQIIMTKEMFDKAFEVAIKIHKGQERWDGQPYISHPYAVSEMVYGYYLKSVAILHDAIEDYLEGPEEAEKLLYEAGIDSLIINDVKTLSRKHGESYATFIKRIRKEGSVAAIQVKICDLKHNLSDLHPKKDRNRIDKYELALAYLERL